MASAVAWTTDRWITGCEKEKRERVKPLRARVGKCLDQWSSVLIFRFLFFSILGFRCRIVLDLGNSFIGWIEFIYLFSNRSFPPLALNFESFSSLTK